jgi:aspartate aminotransferase
MARRVPPSPTLDANERIRALLAGGRPVVHLAFGEAGLPVHPVLREVLDAASSRNAYPAVSGTVAAREAAAGYFGRRRLPVDPSHIVFAPGSKPLLFALLLALEGDLLLPQPSWVSYASQAHLAAKRVIRIPIPEEAGGVPDPAILGDWARRHPGRRAAILITIPDNPTGTVASKNLIEAVCSIAREHDWWIISDEIYRDLAYEPDSLTSPAEFLPERTVVTSGLSKNLALGGWRIGFARFPDDEEGRKLLAAVQGIASEVWSAMAAPMQEVAAFALKEPKELTEFVAAARRLHMDVTLALHQVFASRGVQARRPAGAFYLYADFDAHKSTLRREGVAHSAALAEHLLDRYELAVLPGIAFGDEPDHLAVRVAGSLLYGAHDEQRWAALDSPRPTELPWISNALDRVGEALNQIIDKAQKPARST